MLEPKKTRGPKGGAELLEKPIEPSAVQVEADAGSLASPAVAECILLVEDSDEDAYLIGEMLDGPGPGRAPVRCFRLADAIETLGQLSAACILLDLSLPDAQGVACLTKLREAVPDVPVVVLTGSGHENVAVRALGAGAQDYLRKDDLTPKVLRRSIRHAVERGRIERELRAKQAELASSNAELDRFAALASHDLSTPVRSISGFAQILLAKHTASMDDRGLDYLARITAGADRMQTLIDDLLVFARTGRSAHAVEDVDTGALAREALGDLEEDVARSGASIELRDLPTVRADAAGLRRVFQNLISNAVKFTESSEPRVTISATQAGSAWLFRVSDDGIGVPAAERSKIFGAFNRLHGRDRFSGTGLGLANCQRVVELHGGRIWCEAGSDGGSSFLFTIAGSTQ